MGSSAGGASVQPANALQRVVEQPWRLPVLMAGRPSGTDG